MTEADSAAAADDEPGLHTTRRGMIVELEVQKQLLALGLDVLTSVTPDAPFDLVAHIDGAFSRVQIKTARLDRTHGFKVNTYIGRNNRRALTSRDCDVILACDAGTKACLALYPNGKATAYVSNAKVEDLRLKSVAQIFPKGRGVRKPVRGVSYMKRLDRWVVDMTLGGRRKHYGSYPSFEDAVAVAAAVRRAHAEGKEPTRADLGWSKRGKMVGSGA